MTSSGILQGKRAVVFGAGGSVGAAVAKEFAAEGAEVYLSGRNKASVDAVKKAIESDGGTAHASAVDALNDEAVAHYLDEVVAKSGRIDIEFNAVGPNPSDFGNGKPAVDVTIDEYMVALSTILKSRIITAKGAARQHDQAGLWRHHWSHGQHRARAHRRRDIHWPRVWRDRNLDGESCIRGRSQGRQGGLS